MPKATKLLLLLAIMLGCLAASTPAEAAKRFYVGGGLGLGFGDIDFVDLSAVFAYHVIPPVTTGVRLTWRSREDGRFDPELTTNDYGAAIFARWFVKRPFFLQAELERLSWEFVNRDLSTSRTENNNFFVGGGVGHPLAPNVSLFVTALYNLSYDSSEIRRPYDSPWVIRAGVGFSF
jgi:hypothetical protein